MKIIENFLLKIENEKQKKPEYNRKLFLILLTLGFIFALIQIPTDLNFGSNYPNKKLLYFLGRGGVIISIIIFWFNVYKKNNISTKDLFIFSMIGVVYFFHGQFFMPGYFLGYMEMIIPLALFFPIPKYIFRTILVFSFILISISVFLTNVSYASYTDLIIKLKIDQFIGVFVVSLIAYFGHAHITLVKEKNEEMNKKFLLLGKNTSILIHDIKNKLSPQVTHSKMLLKKFPENLSVIELNNSITDLKDFIILKNQEMSFDKINDVDVKNTLKEIIIKNKDRIDDINIKHEGDLNIKGNSLIIESLFMNLINNSIEKFSEGLYDYKEITVSFNKNKIIYQDSAGGFSEDALLKINNDEYFSEKSQGSGFGIFTIKNIALNHFKGKVFFKNVPNKKAQISIIIDPDLIIK